MWLLVQREGQHPLSPFQLMCGTGAPLVSVVVSRDKLQLLGVPQIWQKPPPPSVTSSESVKESAPRLAVTLTRRHKLFLSRCSLMHLSLIPPPYKNTKTNTCLPCSNYTCVHRLTGMGIVCFTERLVNVKQKPDASSLPPSIVAAVAVFCLYIYIYIIFYAHW